MQCYFLERKFCIVCDRLTKFAPERRQEWISDYSGVDTEQRQRSGTHTLRLGFPAGGIVGLYASIFLLLFVWHMTTRTRILEKSNCFSISPSFSQWIPYVRSLHKYTSSHHLDREGVHQVAVSLLAGIQHFMPGVTHQASHHSAVKCQQSQIPPPCLRFQHQDDERVCSGEWVSSLALISILSVYSMASLQELDWSSKIKAEANQVF